MYYIFALLVFAIVILAVALIKTQDADKCNQECNQGRNCKCKE